MIEFRCKHCGSLNLELEEKGNQTGLYCCDCGKWLKWVTKEEKRVFNNKNICTPIYASKGATNGDMIKAMFPNIEIKPRMAYGIKMGIRAIVHIDEHTIFELWFPTQWWDAPYGKDVRKNDLYR